MIKGDKRIIEASNYIETLANEEVRKEIKEYIDSEIEFQVQNCFQRLFKAKLEDVGFNFCRVCGEQIKNGSEFCSDHNGNDGMFQAIRNWKFIITRYPQLGLAIINTMKKEGEM